MRWLGRLGTLVLALLALLLSWPLLVDMGRALRFYEALGRRVRLIAPRPAAHGLGECRAEQRSSRGTNVFSSHPTSACLGPQLSRWSD